jgi:hypothetical protein
LVVGNHKAVYEDSSTLACASHHSDEVLLSFLWFFLDEGKSQIKANVLAVFIVKISHLGGDDEEDIGDVWISGVDLMDILLILRVIVANASQVFVYFLICDVLLVDVEQVLRQVAIRIAFFIKSIKKFP